MHRARPCILWGSPARSLHEQGATGPFYRAKDASPDADNDWVYVCANTRNKLVAVCDFYM